MSTVNKSNSVLYISHGGGPLPLLGDDSHQELISNLKNLSTILRKPSAIVVISAHWEEEKATITSGKNPQLIYDYYGFPKESYEIQYPVAGVPLLAEKVYSILTKFNIEARLDEQRGFDHGLFVPLKIMYPSANIPCIQLSLVKGLNPAEHIRIGNVLSNLPDENLLIIGSGFSFHNIRAFFLPSTEESQKMNNAFEQWLINTCSSQKISESERQKRLESWEDAPSARYCHPREDHLIPLHVCYGISKSAAKKVFQFKIMNKNASAYLW